jgi:dTDP-4-amino-4,6-dideoxygalactose transaminase
MTEMQGALGRWALMQLEGWLAARRHNADVFSEKFRSIEAVRVGHPPDYIKHAYYKYYVFVQPEKLKPDWNRQRLMQVLGEAGMPVFSGSCAEMYLEQSFQQAGLAPQARFPVARKLGDTSLMFLVHPTITEAEMAAMNRCIGEIFAAAS